MKIKLTETQYKKLFKEDSEQLSVGSTITPKILKIMRSLNKFYTNTDKTIKELKNDWGLSDVDATTIVYNYEKTFKNLSDNEYESFLGKPLEFQGNYVISVNLPTTVYCRTFLDYEITVKAGSAEEALSNAVSKIIDDNFNEINLPNTKYNRYPDLDWDIDDTELVRDMAQDILRDFSDDWTSEEINKYITLKK